jgi:hypothetical protein
MSPVEDIMRTRSLPIVISLLFISAIEFTTLTIAENPLAVSQHAVTITTMDNKLVVKETVLVTDYNPEDTLFTYWLQENVADVSIQINGTDVYYTTMGNEYNCNLSGLLPSTTSGFTMVISYDLPKEATMFTKTLLTNTTQFTVTFDTTQLYSADDLSAGSSFSLRLYEPQEPPLQGYMILFIVLLVILLIVSTFYSFRKQKAAKLQDIMNESTELLQAKKQLLLTTLKDIEKQHRSKKISDDTYHKLKDYYKQQAVDAMRKLDDMESEHK